MNNLVISKRLMPLISDSIEVKLTEQHVNMQGNVFNRSKTYLVIFNVCVSGRTERDDYVLRKPEEEFNFFCYNKHNRITCWPIRNGTQPITEDGLWAARGRQEIKPGKFLMLFYKDLQVTNLQNECTVYDESERTRVVNRACEIFASRVKGQNEDLIYDISDRPSDIYKILHHPMSGYLKNSCMRYRSKHDCSKYAGFYNNIPGLKIIYRVVSDKLLFRALLWEGVRCSRTGESYTFLDRIYASESIQIKLRELAQEKKWLYREFSSDTVLDWNGSSVVDDETTLKFPIPTKAIRYAHRYGCPYVDTLAYMEREKETNLAYLCSNSCGYYKGNTVKSLQSCEGDTISLFAHCRVCNKLILDQHDEIDGVYLCKKCYKDRVGYCEHCQTAHLKSNMHRWQESDEYFCSDCISDLGLVVCRQCGQLMTDFTILKDNDHEYKYCHTCYENLHTCDICHKKVNYHTSNVIRVQNIPNPIRVCYDCSSQSIVTCTSCGRSYLGVLPFNNDDTREFIPCTHPACIEHRTRQLTRQAIHESRWWGTELHSYHIIMESEYLDVTEQEEEHGIEEISFPELQLELFNQ